MDGGGTVRPGSLELSSPSFPAAATTCAVTVLGLMHLSLLEKLACQIPVVVCRL